MENKVWRTDPQLAGRFHPEYPDDLQVIVHDGSPRLTPNRPEVVWVTVTGYDGQFYRGVVLNQPHQLVSVRANDEIAFKVVPSVPHPVYLSAKYLGERPNWNIRPCDKCGFSDLFDAPSDLIAKIFPNLPADQGMMMFSTFCPLCGGVLIVRDKSLPDE